MRYIARCNREVEMGWSFGRVTEEPFSRRTDHSLYEMIGN